MILLQFWDPVTLMQVHSISSKEGLSHWVRALVYDKRKVCLNSLIYNECSNSIALYGDLLRTLVY